MSKQKSYSNNSLTLDLLEDEASIRVTWLGKSIERTPGDFLNPILVDFVDESERKGKELVLDFCRFAYMNSSTIMTVSKVLEIGRDRGCKIHVLYNKELSWQKLSFSALRIFQTSDQRIRIEGITGDKTTA